MSDPHGHADGDGSPRDGEHNDQPNNDQQITEHEPPSQNIDEYPNTDDIDSQEKLIPKVGTHDNDEEKHHQEESMPAISISMASPSEENEHSRGHMVRSASESVSISDAGHEKDTTGGISNDDEETLMDLMNPERKHRKSIDKQATMSDLIRDEIDSLKLNVVPELGTNIEDLLTQVCCIINKLT
jgi:hypothetical protein